MTQIFVVFGITGKQGASVAKQVLSTPSLSSKFKIRGVTRDMASPSARRWTENGIEMVAADLDDALSLKTALDSAHTVFGMTNSPFDNAKKHIEVKQGQRLTEAAVAAGVKHLIWSTTPSANAISGGSLMQVGHFDAKAEVDDYIRKTSIAYTLFSPAAFMQNFFGPFKPISMGPNDFGLMQFVSPETQVPLLDVVQDTGKYIGAILENPESYYGKTVAAAGGVYTFQALADILSKVSGKNVVFKQIPEDSWKSHIPEGMREELAEMMKLFQDYGYWGKDTARLISEGRKGVSDVTGFECFVKENLAMIGLA